MRMPRCKADEECEAAYYHCISRVVNRDFIFGPDEKEHFVKLMRGYETFCQVQIVTYCIMSNHFHLLIKVPRRPIDPALLPNGKELVSLARQARYSHDAPTLKQELDQLRAAGEDSAAEELREKLFCRMWDVSWFMKMLKQRFSQWYNWRTGRKGTLWEERFRSVLVEGTGPAIAIMAAYIDLNPVRAGMVEDPANYRWSGYGEAMAGGSLARQGLRVAVEALRHEPVPMEEGSYRVHLYFAGQERKGGIFADGPVAARKGFSAEEVEAMIAKGGKIPLAEALRCRVRYFSYGLVLGSRAFVEAFFNKHRARFSPRRKSGARRMRGIDAGDLFTVRDLRSNVLG